MKRILIIIVLTWGTCSTTYAGEVADIFSKSIFELKWLSPKEEVIKKYPKGKLKTDFGITAYKIKDGRKLFDIEREQKNYINFSFNGENQLSGVGIQFPMKSADDFGKLLTKLNTYFGPGESIPNSLGVIAAQWPEDQGIKISLSQIPGVLGLGYLLFGVEYTTPIKVRKENLGF